MADDNKKDECCNCLQKCFMLMLLFYMLLSYFLNFVYLPEDNFLKAIDKSWNQYPILDISLTQKEGYKEMTFMHWELDEDICECSNIKHYEDTYEGKCSDIQIEKGCNEYNKYNNSTKLHKTSLYAKYYQVD